MTLHSSACPDLHNAPKPVKIPTGRRAKRSRRENPDEPIDYAYREAPPAERPDQPTRKGYPKSGLNEGTLAGRQWFILSTAPREEMRATLILERAGHAVLYPRHAVYRRRNRYSKSKIGILRPLMVRYLFVGFVGEPNWMAAQACSSITGVVGLNGKPMPIAYANIAAFMLGLGPLAAPDEHRHMPTHREFGVGDRVEILTGPLRGEHVQVQRITGRFAFALMDMGEGGQCSAQIALDNLGALR